MASKEHAVLDYGVIFTKDDLDFEKVKAVFDNVDFTDINFDNDFELCMYFDSEEDCSHYSEFNGEAFLLNDQSEIVELPQEFVLGFTSHFPCFFKAQYKDYDDLKQDLVNKFGKFLKDDFPWDDRIVNLIGTVWG